LTRTTVCKRALSFGRYISMRSIPPTWRR